MERTILTLLAVLVIAISSFGLWFYIKLDKIEKDIDDFLNR
jgi:hypothetical protein